MVGVVPHGLTPKGIAALLAWQTRRERYGENGLTPQGVATARRTADQYHQRQRRQRTCQHGHLWRRENEYRRHDGVRQCKACALIRADKQRWRRKQAQAQAHLRQAMILAHPDRGGTVAKFLKARKAYLAATAA